MPWPCKVWMVTVKKRPTKSRKSTFLFRKSDPVVDRRDIALLKRKELSRRRESYLFGPGRPGRQVCSARRQELGIRLVPKARRLTAAHIGSQEGKKIGGFRVN